MSERRSTADTSRDAREGSDEIRRAAFRVLRMAADGDVAPSDQAYVGAAALNVTGLEEARRKLVRPGQDDVWRLWAERCAAPARGRLLSLADAGRRAA